ncbi:hypothetical protein [Shewanella sp. T24-MNA-CIBAN-0130]|uniref:hypothetical protein n=1 Tax=Shewanella sp. T24-MNA-CIBAN-0130 TaxID=3140470 RepID=UPI003330A73D
MNEMICAFSSDSRELYKADIYRTVNLPDAHIVHFRYKRKYVEEAVLIAPEAQYGKEVLIFFTVGNSLDSVSNCVENVPIRKAKIVNIQIDNDTDVCHIYMQLGKFWKARISESNDQNVMPTNKFFTTLELEDSAVLTWKETVESILTSFTDKVFTYIQEVRDQDCAIIKLKYDKTNKASYYEFTQGKRYHVKIATANPIINSCKIQLENSSDEIEFHCISPLESTVQFDRQIIPLTVKESSTRQTCSTLTFTPTTKESGHDDKEIDVEHKEYSTLIEIRSKQSVATSIIFGVASTFLVAGLGLGRSAFKEEFSLGLFLLAALLITGSAAFLHHFFNKK